ncbi:hypothetical protein JCM1840_004714 [Sporobolomyces johnsonii]
MAAAVMRAMTFGATSSREGRPSSSAGRDKDHSSRNSSRNRLSWGLSTKEQDLERERDRAGEEPRSSLSLSRSRSSSRLNPSTPACTGRGPTGILLNANRPASDSPIPLLSPTSSPPNGGVYHDPSSASSSTASNLDLARTVSFDATSPPTSTVTRPSPPMRSHSSSSILQYPSLTSNHDQSRSSSTSCGEPSISSSPTGGELGEALACSGTMTADSSTTGSVSTAAARKIRFAPLPQIRPRAYSTGRNLWFEGADFEGEAAEGEEGATRRLVRRENTDEHALEDDYDDDHDEVAGGPLQKWGSWGEIGAWVAGSKKDKDDDAISVASSTGGGASAAAGADTPTPSSKDAYSKILKPWRFGKSKKSKSSFPRKDSDEGTGLGGGAALSRQSSADSDVSRRSSVDVGVLTSTGPRPKVSTGVPMRKANTWDSSESPSSNSRPSSLRGSASPIARSSSSYGQHSQSQPIYYASPARTGTRRANYPPVAQRSRLARPPQKQPAKVDEPAFHEWGSSRSVGSVGSATSKSGGEEDDGSGMAWIRRRRAQREREEKEKREREERGGDKDAVAPATARDDSTTPVELVSRGGAPEELPTHADDHNDDEIRARERKFPARTSTLDSTVSSVSTVMPTPPSPSLTGSSTPTRSLSALSMTRPSLSGDTAVSSAGSTATAGTATSTAKWEKEGEEGVVMIDEPEEEEDDDEEDEDDDDEGEKPDDESDLDEDELAQEEALMQAARRTAKGAGHERYHSASHRNKLTVVEHVKQPQPTRRASTSSNSAGVNVKGA